MYTLLSIAKAHHASDLHITVGVRPKCSILETDTSDDQRTGGIHV